MKKKTSASKKVNTVATLRKVLRYLRHYRLLFALSLLLAVVVVGLTLYFPILTGEAIDLIVGPGQVDFASLAPLLLRGGIIIGITALCQWLMNICNNRITFGVVRRLRHDAFVRIQSLPLSYLDKRPVGDTVSRVIADADQVTDGLLMGFSQFFTGILTILGTLCFMLSLNLPMTLWVVVATPLSLFDLSHTLAADHMAGFTYPWEALKGIKELILTLGPTLDQAEYTEVSPHVWVHNTATVAPTAYLGSPCIIGANTEVRHCAFVRGSALVGEADSMSSSTAP